MTNNILVPSVKVQMYFDPEIIQPGKKAGLIVKLIPVGEYRTEHIEALEKWNLEFCVAFELPGFTYKTKDPHILPNAKFIYKGSEMEERISLLAGERVSGTDYFEMVYINNSLKYLMRDGHFAPGAGGCYLRRPGQPGNYPVFELFDK